MSEIVYKVMLHSVELYNFMIIYKNYKNPYQNDSNKNRKNQYYHPRLRFQKLTGVEVEFMNDFFKPWTNPYIPVDI